MDNKKLVIRELIEGESLPYELIFLADPSEEMVNKYIHKSHIYTIEINYKTIGVCVLYPINRNMAEIKNVAIDEEYQQQGYGKALMNKVIEEAGEKGYEELIIGTGNCGFSQLYMYQRLGFEMYEIKLNFFVDNYKEPIFENGIQCKHMVMLKKILTRKL